MGRGSRWWRRDFFLDLGTTTTLFAAAGATAFRSEASLLILRRGLKEPYAAGDQVRQLVGRLPPSYRLARPYREGRLENPELLEQLLAAITRETLQVGWRRRHVWVSVPMASTSSERQVAVRVLRGLGAARVHLTAEPYVLALGSGALDQDGRVAAVVNVGGEATELAILSREAVVAAQVIPVGGRALDEAVREWALTRAGVEVSPLMAEEAKLRLGSLRPEAAGEEDPIPVAGKNLKTGLPSRIQVEPALLRSQMADQVRLIAAAMQRLLEGCSAEVSGDLLERGIVLTGGGSRMEGFEKVLEEELKLAVHKEPEPEAYLLEGFHRWLSNPGLIPAEGVHRPAREKEKAVFPGIPQREGPWYAGSTPDLDAPLPERLTEDLGEVAVARAPEAKAVAPPRLPRGTGGTSHTG
ncbi:rod shape-determining protein [Limnochorda pilosa]|uniref:Cell shape-determining protein MreB n=1 Tax=Limnochorda pilosa TaxID=1555112 RepID=A0A0K2SPU3_LIMPI|nr:rod shape-determining protein [Limnochorda pilosa]BAS29140.1 hypothetical protein LIP_3327 [Limnochorda pilosa]